MLDLSKIHDWQVRTAPDGSKREVLVHETFAASLKVAGEGEVWLANGQVHDATGKILAEIPHWFERELNKLTPTIREKIGFPKELETVEAKPRRQPKQLQGEEIA